MNSPTRALSATETKNRFGAVLREVTRTGGPILIERGGRPVAVILSMEAYRESCQKSPPVSPDRRELAHAAFGMWAKRPDIHDDWLAQSRRQWRSDWANG